MQNLKKIIVLLIILISISLYAENKSFQFNVKHFGAVGDGKNLDTESIQKAIDAAAEKGGVVTFPPGAYYTETLILRDHVTLFIDQGAILLGSTEITAFKSEYGSFRDSGGRRFGSSLLFARGATHIVIKGNGIIDGQGFPEYYPVKQGIARPSLIRFIDCRDVLVEDITLINSAAWVQHYVRCDDLTIRGITVRSHTNKNNDGLDIESCQRVHISGCHIDTGDDSIVLKTLTTRPCRDVVISDCIVSGLKSAIKTGTESAGGFENISISNCVFYGTRGLTFYTVDGGTINNITVSNISMRDSYGVICLRLGDRLRPYTIDEEERPRSPGTFRNIIISNIQAVGVTESNCFISGIPGHFIENVTLDNIRILYKGGGFREDSERIIPELSGEYPKPRMFGKLPAYGLFVRHARNVKIRNSHFSYVLPDHRSVLYFNDVNELHIDGLTAESCDEAAPFIWLKETGNVFIHGCRSVRSIETFLKIEGGLSRHIIVTQNWLSQAKNRVDLDSEVLKESVVFQDNY
jgi:hypothetical protein